MNKLDKLFIIIFCYGLFEILNTYYITEVWFTSFNGFRMYYFGILYYFIVRFYLTSKEKVRSLVVTVLCMTFVVSVALFIEVIIINTHGSFEPIPWLWNAPEGLTSVKEGFAIRFYGFEFIRPYGIFNSQSVTGAFIGLGLLITSVFYMGKYRLKGKIIFTVLFYVFFLALLVSTSRTFIFSFLICLILIVLKYRLINLKLVMLLIVMALFCMYNNEALNKYLFSIVLSGEDPTLQSFKHHSDWEFNLYGFLFGRGFELGQIERLVMGIQSVRSENQYQFMGIESEIRIFSMLGVIGLLGTSLFFLQNIIAYKMGIRFVRKEKDRYYKYIMTSFPFFIVMLLIATFHYIPVYNPTIQCYYYIILGTISSLSSIKSRSLPAQRKLKLITGSSSPGGTTAYSLEFQSSETNERK